MIPLVAKGKYTMGAVALKTGLSPHTIRAWERRYSALTPDRTGTNRRLYADEDVERLDLLRRATELGHGIGQISSLPLEELRGLTSNAAGTPRSPGTLLAQCEAALDGLNPEALEEALSRGVALLGIPNLLDSVVVPFLDVVGKKWEEGNIGIAHEHMATSVVRTFLDHVRLSISSPRGAPRILVTTPARQLHEIGAVLVAITAATEGWHVTYLGPNLPASEIAAAAKQSKMRATALSLVFPLDDPGVAEELRQLRGAVGDMPILVGGRGAPAYAEVLQEVRAIILGDLPMLRTELATFRRS